MVHRAVATVRHHHHHYHHRGRIMHHHRCYQFRCRRAWRYRIPASTRAKCFRLTPHSSILTGVIRARCHHHLITCRQVHPVGVSSFVTRHRYHIHPRCFIQRYSRRPHIEEAPITVTSGWTAPIEVVIAIPATSATTEFNLQYPLLMLILMLKLNNATATFRIVGERG